MNQGQGSSKVKLGVKFKIIILFLKHLSPITIKLDLYMNM